MTPPLRASANRSLWFPGRGVRLTSTVWALFLTLLPGVVSAWGTLAEIAWVARYDGNSGFQDQAQNAVTDAQGNVYVTGTSHTARSASAPMEDRVASEIATVKYDSSGNQLWVRRFSPAAGRTARAAGMSLDKQGNLIIGGTAEQSNGRRSFATLKYSQDGTLQWVQYFHGPGVGDDAVTSLDFDPAGNIYVSGNATAANGKHDIGVVKYAPDGTQLWTASYDGPAHGEESAQACIADAQGNYYVSGASPGLQSGMDIILLKYDTLGNQVWARRYSGPGAHDDMAVEMGVDAGGNLYAIGSLGSDRGSDIITLKYDVNGMLLWAQTYDGPDGKDDFGYLLAVDKDGYVHVQGQSNDADGSSEAVTIKYAPDGTQLWAKRFHPSAAGQGNGPYGVILDSSGNVYTCTVSGYNGEGNDIAVLKYDPNGHELWLRRYDGPSHNEDFPGYYNPMVLDKDNNLIVTGASRHGTDADSEDYVTFKIQQNDDGSGIQVVHDFDDVDGTIPGGVLLLASNGNLYGTTSYGGTDSNGTFYRIGADGHFTTLYNFGDTVGHNPSPGQLVELNGQYYGTLIGDPSGQDQTAKGGVYRIDPAGSLPKPLHTFTGTDGSHPQAGLTLGADGNFYGVTLDGGANGGGVFFQITPTGLYNKLLDFDNSTGTAPHSSLLRLDDGTFLCACTFGGSQGGGTILQLTTTGQRTKLHDFAYTSDDGGNPVAGIFRGANGRYYGLSSAGGNHGGGVFFELQLSGQTTAVYEFDLATGGVPVSNPALASDGVFYGVVNFGGPDGIDGRGALYRLTASGEYSVLHYFADEFSGSFTPNSSPTESADGQLYIPVLNGGTDNNGFLFRVPVPVPPAGNVLADSVNDFSGLQGTLNWFYGYYGTAGDPATFTSLGYSSADGTWKNAGALPFLTQTSAQAGPDGATQVVRRWQVSRTGKIRVAGNFGASFAGGNGTLFRVLYDGTEEFSQTVIGSNQGTFSVDIDAVSGKYLDFVVDPLGDLNGDTLNYRATITNIDSGNRGLRAGQIVAAAPAFDGALTVNLTGAGGAGQWRLQGELSWRDSGSQLSGLAAGDYLVEFQTVNGLAPDPELVHVASGSSTSSFDYPNAGDVIDGGVIVHIKPDYVANAVNLAQQGQWRRQGETVYHSSGELQVLPAGLHLIEFKGVAGKLTPLTASVLISPGAVSEFTVTYFPQPAVSGDQPAGLSLMQATSQAPYAYCGQIQSDAGSGTGFAVADRVVLTAGHVVFDDASLTFTSGLRWYFQRMAGEAEPAPMIPRGTYLLDGYAVARQTPGVVPGESTLQSQQEDVGALYFDSTPSRGGYSGYLVSSPQYQWVGMAGQKTIVGYPVDEVDESERGLMHATPLEPVNFTLAPAIGDALSQVWRTQQIGGLPGMSGGPLFVEYDGGGLYPAAIFIGGNGESLVRAIDAQVELLIQSAFISASTGKNNTSGGVVQVNARISTSTFTLTSLTVNLTPSTGTSWRLVDAKGVTGLYRDSGSTANNIALGRYKVQFSSLPGYATPADMVVSLDAPGGTTISTSYQTLPKPVVSGQSLVLASGGLPFTYPIIASGNPGSYALSGDVPDGLSLVGSAILGTPTETIAPGGAAVDHMVQVRATSPAGTSDPFTLDIRIEPKGTLTVAINNAAGGTITPSLSGTLQKPQGSQITLVAKPKKNYLFAGWTGDEPATTAKLSFPLPQLASITANFVPNPFPSVIGNYSGLIATTPVAFARSGLVSLTVAKSGSFTGTLLLGPTKFPLKGVIFPDGTYHGSTHVKTVIATLDFTIALAPSADRVITGTVTQNSVVTAFIANLCPVFTQQSPSSQAGTYTWILPHDVNRAGAGVPQGDGYASIVVKSDGTVHLTGALGDGTKLSQGGRLVNAGAWPFFIPLYKSSGAITGTISYSLANDFNTAPPAVNWFRLPGSGTPYNAGFAAPITPLLGTYSAVSPLSLNTLEFAVDQTASDAPPPFQLSTDAKNHVLPPAKSGFTLKVTAKTGLFSGQFLNPTNRKPVGFGGALLQSRGSGFGSYLGATKTAGFVELSPQP